MPKEESPSEVKLLFGTTTPLQSGSVSAVLRGRATKSLIQVDKSLVDFDWVDVGETVSSGEITVVNKSAQQQQVTLTMKTGAPYSLEKPALDNPLPPEGSATFKVIFAPNSPDSFEDEVFVSLKTGEPETTIKVRGNGRDIMAGGGGCSCGSTEAGTAGLLTLLALVGLSSRRWKRE
jgi:MYXO-CTERM domain-containing protein